MCNVSKADESFTIRIKYHKKNELVNDILIFDIFEAVIWLW